MTRKTTRRAILAGAAAIPVLSLPAMASGGDGSVLMAAIDRYYRAAQLSDAANEDARLSESPELSDEQRNTIYADHTAAFGALLNHTPQTPAGVVSYLRVLQHWGDTQGAHLFEDWYPPISEPAVTVLARLADVLEKAA